MPDEGDSGGRSDRPGPAGELRWRVNGRLTGLKIAVAVVFLGLAALFGADLAGLVVALVAAAALAAFALRDLMAPVRLAADAGGVTVVTGFAGHRHLPWASIERIRVDERHRLGVRSQLLEIDAGDSLHLFSGYELSAPCEDVAVVLQGLRSQATRPA
ncbi:PH domain-containing protein [Planosporangium thailandense]|uniref:PH domain-containing protein n=1 Tax=Planosporangium thailandense TaxID=765197 RepID=A0ABX0XRT8_9ACTN|nr:PH domain-containing protein [Planosporangium thailandense]NJC68721.1 PH domain-containing protein [Planosporangium thailandense]